MRLLNLSDAEVVRCVEGFRNHPEFCRRALSIQDKFGQVVPMELMPGQAKLTKAIDRQRGAGVPVRVIVLKGRQTRISAGAATHLFRELAFLPGQNGLSVAHLLKSAANIWGYVDQYDRSYRRYAGVDKLERVRHLTPAMNRAGMIGWGGTRDRPASVLTSATAKNVEGGRSASVRHLHLSEFAFYENAAAYMTGLIPSVPSDPFTTIVIESTANGRGGAFHRMWREAVAGISEYLAVFVPWFDEASYTAPVPHGFEPDKNERELMTAHGLVLGQIVWRRRKIVDLGSEDAFKQEFPGTPEEAFLTSGRPRFQAKHLVVMPIDRQPLVGELEEERIGTRTQLVFRPNESGCMKIFKRPQPGKRYVVGADPAKGIDVAEKGAPADPDWFAAPVFDHETGEQVAIVRARFTPHAAAEYTAALCRYYNMAYLVPEANELAFIQSLLQFYPVEHIYQRHREADDRRPPTLHEIGWYETQNSRTELIGYLDAALREGEIVIHDETTQDEMYSFVYKANGRAEHEVGCHDDTVFGSALGCVGRLTLPQWMAPQPLRNATTAKVVDYRKARRGGDDDDDEPRNHRRR